MKRNKALRCIILILLPLILAAILLISLEITQNRLSDKMIRLHVIANSDSDEDQSMKLLVRDTVLAVISRSIDSKMSRKEAESVIRMKFDEIVRSSAALTGGMPVSVTLDNEFYPTKDYGSFSLPSGEYLSLRVMIGEAEGHNWWCVLFPPLCTELCTDETAAVWGLTEGENALIHGESGYVVRFRLIEWWEQLKHKLGQ